MCRQRPHLRGVATAVLCATVLSASTAAVAPARPIAEIPGVVPGVMRGGARTVAHGENTTRVTRATRVNVPSFQICTPTRTVYCFRDTAFSRRQTDPSYPDWLKTAEWIWFSAAGDSIELSVTKGSIATNLGQAHDSLRNTASYFRHRVGNDGVMFFQVTVDSNTMPDSIAYTLEVHRYGPEPGVALRATGGQATLRSAAPFSIVPRAKVATVTDLSKWRLPEGAYKIALLADSVYQVCDVPCRVPETITLRPGARVTYRRSPDRR